MKKILTYLLLSVLLYSVSEQAVIGVVHAAAESDYIKKEIPKAMYKKGVESPFNIQTSNIENIDPIRGDLEVARTDLSLKGKNGLDFNLTRFYSSRESNIYESDTSSFVTFNDARFNLGAGWAFDLPQVEVRDSWPILHRGKQGTWYFKNGSNDGKYIVDGYLLQDFGFYTDPLRSFTNGQTTSLWYLQEVDGKKTYFDEIGTLLGIVDRFGNKITFNYQTITVADNTTRLALTQVTDSVGRIINFSYSGLTQMTVSVTGEGITKTIQYNKLQVKSKTMTYQNSILPEEYLLDNVADESGAITRYEYMINSGNLNFDPSLPNHTNFYVLLLKTTFPTGALSMYIFNKYTRRLATNGWMESFHLTERLDNTGSRTTNHFGYTYTHQFANNLNPSLDYDIAWDGYPSFNFQTDKWLDYNHDYTFKLNTKVFDVARGTNVTYNFNTQGLMKKITDEGDNHKIETLQEYDGTNQLTKKITNTYSKTTSQVMKAVENYTFNEFKSILKYTGPEATRDATDNPANSQYSKTYDYYTPYQLPKTTFYERETGYTLLDDYQLSTGDGGKTIKSITHRWLGLAKDKTEFNYDTYGNVIEEIQTPDMNIPSQTISTKYDYTNNVNGRSALFDGAFLTKKWVDGVKAADGSLVPARSGNAAGRVDEIYKYDYYGNMIENQDAQGNTNFREYDILGRVKKGKYPDGTFKESIYRVDPTEVSVTVRDENFGSLNTAYNSYGNQTKYVYDSLGNLTYQQLWNGSVFKNLYEFKYDYNNQLLQETDSLKGTTVNYHYYSDGITRQRDIQDSAGTILSYELYSVDYANTNGLYNKLTKRIYGDANSPMMEASFSYNKAGNLMKSEQMHNGNTYKTTYVYDNMGDKMEEKSARGNAEQWSDIATLKYKYDYAGRPIEQTDVAGNKVTSEYNSLGQLIKQKDPRANADNKNFTQEFKYDSLGRVIQKATAIEDIGIGPETYNAYEQYKYDRNGNKLSDSITTYNLGNTSQGRAMNYSYDSRNRLILTKEGMNDINRYSQYYYDPTGNIIRMYTGLNKPLTINGLDSVTTTGDADYSVQKYEYNNQGKRTKSIDALDQIETSTYDQNGNELTHTDRNGNQTAQSFDALNRLHTSTVTGTASNAGIQKTFEYYLNGNLKSAANNQSSSVYSYDDLGRMVKEVADGVTKAYDYDADGHRTSFKVTIGAATTPALTQTYTYDKPGRLYQVYADGQLAATYTYDANGNTTHVDYSNGTTSDMTYNKANQIKTVTNKKGATVLSQYIQTYNSDLNIDTVNDGTGAIKYIYDQGGRVSQINEPGGKYTNYWFDDYGNRQQILESQTDQSKNRTTYDTYDKNNRLLLDKKVVGLEETSTSYNYDANGNTLFKTTSVVKPIGQTTPSISLSSDEIADSPITTYGYDAINQLTSVTAGGHSVQYAYSANGLRNQKVTDGVVQKHIWDGQAMVMELDGNNAQLNKYVRGSQLLYSSGAQNTKQFYLNNNHGDVAQLTDSSGNVIKTYKYDAFGTELNPSSTDLNPFRYAGEYLDKETQTYYLRARSYDPSIGRFIKEDTYEGEITNPLSLNLYTYVHNNPLTNVDPSGHEAQPGIWAGAMLDAAKNSGSNSQLYWDIKEQMGVGRKWGDVRLSRDKFLDLFNTATMTGCKDDGSCSYSSLDEYLTAYQNAAVAKQQLMTAYDKEYVESGERMQALAMGLIGEGPALGKVVKGWIERKTYQEIAETLGKEAQEKFSNSMNKGFVNSAFGSNGIKRLSGDGIKIGNTTYNYEIKITGKYDSWRVLGNYDSATGHYMFNALEKTHK